MQGENSSKTEIKDSGIKEYFTSNMNLVVWFATRGIGYNRMYKTPDSTIMFVFYDTEVIRKEIQNFSNNFDLQSFLRVQKVIKNEIVQMLKSN